MSVLVRGTQISIYRTHRFKLLPLYHLINLIDVSITAPLQQTKFKTVVMCSSLHLHMTLAQFIIIDPTSVVNYLLPTRQVSLDAEEPSLVCSMGKKGSF